LQLSDRDVSRTRNRLDLDLDVLVQG
jgi:hypothetical protein